MSLSNFGLVYASFVVSGGCLDNEDRFLEVKLLLQLSLFFFFDILISYRTVLCQLF